jgi:hypothetical protein
MFIVDDLLFLGPVIVAAIRAMMMSGDGANSAGSAGGGYGGGDPVAACRAAVLVEPELHPTNAMRGGYVYYGRDPDLLSYLHGYLASVSAAATNPRSVLAFAALLQREGSTAAINTYDSQLFTWGVGWGGLGGLPRVMDQLASDPMVSAALAACGVWYIGGGNWTVIDGSGHAVTGKAEALQVIRQTPALLNLFIQVAKDPNTRDAVANAQLAAFLATSGNVPAGSTISTQALYNLVTHLQHWAPNYMTGVLEAAAKATPGSPSPDRDRSLARQIVQGFYARAMGHGWVPDWHQTQQYVLKDMAVDGLDVSGDPVLAAASAPNATAADAEKTVAGCGQNWASFKRVGGPSSPHDWYAHDFPKTAGGCGQLDYPDATSVCGSWGPWADAYFPFGDQTPAAVKVVSGPGEGPRGGDLFFVGDVVQWRAALDGSAPACAAPPCDPRPGSVVQVRHYAPGTLRGGFVVGDSGQAVLVRYDGDAPTQPPLEWPAESLVLSARPACAPRTVGGAGANPDPRFVSPGPSVDPRMMGGPGAQPPGYAGAYEVFTEPELAGNAVGYVLQRASGPQTRLTQRAPIGSGFGETADPNDPQRRFRTIQGPGLGGSDLLWVLLDEGYAPPGVPFDGTTVPGATAWASLQQFVGASVTPPNISVAGGTSVLLGWYLDPVNPQRGADYWDALTGAYVCRALPDITPFGGAFGSIYGKPADPLDWSRGIADKTAQGPGTAAGAAGAASAPIVGTHGGGPSADQIAAVKRGIVAAVQDGSFDAPQWDQIVVGDPAGVYYDVMVTLWPLAVGGLRLPTSFEDQVAVANLMGALPITKAVSDARWAQAARQLPAQPLPDTHGEVINDPGQVVRYNALLGPNGTDLVDGFWKEGVLVTNLSPQPNQRGALAQYGFKRADGTMYEHGGPSKHDGYYKGYSNTPTYMSRKAVRHNLDGTTTNVDLVEELASDTAFGPALPSWLLGKFSGGGLSS